MNLPFYTIPCSQSPDLFQNLTSLIRESKSLYESECFFEIVLFSDNDDINKRNFMSIRNAQGSSLVFKSTTYDKQTSKVTRLDSA